MTELETATNQQLAESLSEAMIDIHHVTKWLPYMAEAIRRLKGDGDLPQHSTASHMS